MSITGIPMDVPALAIETMVRAEILHITGYAIIEFGTDIDVDYIPDKAMLRIERLEDKAMLGLTGRPMTQIEGLADQFCLAIEIDAGADVDRRKGYLRHAGGLRRPPPSRN